MATKSEQIRLERLEGYRRSLRYYAYSLYEGAIDAVLDYLHEYYKQRPYIPAGFKPDVLHAVKAINRFAAEEHILFEDALLVLHTLAHKPLPEKSDS